MTAYDFLYPQNQNPLCQSPEMQCTNVACEKERKEAEISMVNIF